MKRIFSTTFSILVAAVLFFPGLTPTANAGTLKVILTEANPQVGVIGNDEAVTSYQGDWLFTVIVKGKVSFLGMNIKNNPGAGDICWHSGSRQPKGNFQLSALNMPTATTNACGNQYVDTNGDPLTLFAYIQTGDPNASVEIDVVYPDPPLAMNRVPSREFNPARLVACDSFSERWA